MPEFTYVARGSDGSLAEGTVQANDRAAAVRQIETLKRVPIRVTVASGGAAAKNGAAPATARGAGVGEADLSRGLSLSRLFLFTEQLAHLLSAGMTLDESLGILVRRLQQPKLQALCRALHQGLVDGRSLSQAMRDFPKVFSPLYLNMVSAGEASGALSQILRRLVTHLSGVKALRDGVRQALFYPAALVIAGIGLVIVFMTVMVPQLTGFFASTGTELPLPTRILLKVHHLFTGYWWLALLAVGGAVAAWRAFTRTPEGLVAWDRFRWNVPALGRIPRYRFYAQFARTLGTLAENGVTLLKSLELLEAISGNEWIRLKTVEVRTTVMDGASLSAALRREELLPELFLDMMAVGEQTGHFPETMQMIADVYERELDKQVQFVSSLVPVLVIVVIAVVVGLVVFGILAAVFNLTSGLHQHVR